MGIVSKQIGWSQESNLLWQILKQLNKLTSIMFGLKPKYKVYTALLTQTGTDAPVAKILENTTGLTITWSRDNIGQYRTNTLNLSESVDKIFCIIQPPSYNNPSRISGYTFGLNYVSAGFPVDFFKLTTRLDENLVDDTLNNTSVEIRVYN